MRVAVFPADTGACGHYRLRWPAAALEGHPDLDVEVREKLPAGEWRDDVRTGQPILQRVLDLNDVDVVVLQRPLEDVIADTIPVLQRQGIAVVVELDDNFHALQPDHPARRDTSASHNRKFNRRNLRIACERADLVTCTTQSIADRYARHGRYRVVPNYVPARYLDVPHPNHDGPPIIGWTGSVQTHPGDLEVTGGAVAQVLADTGAHWHTVGTGVGVPRRLGLPEGTVTTASGWVELDDYPHAYAALDVAVVPLQLNRFNEAKSWLKGIEAAALGVPFVASPTGPYLDLYRLGIGSLAKNPAGWRAHLTEYVTHGEWREECAGSGRELVRDRRLTIEDQAHQWADAWTHAAHSRSGRRAA